MRTVDATALSAVCSIVLAAAPASADWYLDVNSTYGGLDLQRVVMDPEHPRAVAVGGSGVLLFDLTDPSSPQVYSPGDGERSAPRRLWLGGAASNQGGPDALLGSQLLDADWQGVRVWGLSDPVGEWPLLGSVEVPDHLATGVAATSAWVAVAWSPRYDPGPEEIVVYDPSTPLPTVELGRLELPEAGTLLAATTDLLIVHTPDAFSVVDLSDPASPTLADHVVVATTAVSAVGSLLAALQAPTTVQLFSLADPGAVVPVGALSPTSPVNSLHLSGLYLYLGGDTETVVADVSNPTSPVVVGSLPTGPAFGIGVLGDALVVAAGTSGALTGRLDGPATLDDVRRQLARAYGGLQNSEIDQTVVEGDRLYVEAASEGVWILDVSDSRSLTELGLWPVPADTARSLAADGTTLYVGTPASLEVVDAADPSAPRTVASLPITGQLTAEGADHGVVAVAVTGGIQLVDARDPATPALGAMIPTPSSPVPLALEGEALVWGDGQMVRVVDVGDPFAPVETAVIDPADLDPEAGGLPFWEFRAAGNGTVGLTFADLDGYYGYFGVGVALDVTDPANAVHAGRFPICMPSNHQLDGPFAAGPAPYWNYPWPYFRFVDRRHPDLGPIDTDLYGGMRDVAVAGYRAFGLMNVEPPPLHVIDFSHHPNIRIFADGFDAGDLSAWTADTE